MHPIARAHRALASYVEVSRHAPGLGAAGANHARAKLATARRALRDLAARTPPGEMRDTAERQARRLPTATDAEVTRWVEAWGVLAASLPP